MKRKPPRPTTAAVSGMKPSVSDAQLVDLVGGLPHAKLTKRERASFDACADFVLCGRELTSRQRDHLISIARANGVMPKPPEPRPSAERIRVHAGDTYSAKPSVIADMNAGVTLSADGKSIVRTAPMPVPPGRRAS